MQKRDRAEIALSQFIDGNPAYAIDKGEPEWYEGTNLITFGSFHNQPVVFKYFDWQPRKVQEEKALRLYGPTALVPKLYPVEHESILNVTSRRCKELIFNE